MEKQRCSGVIIYRYNAKDDDFEILLIKTRNFKDKTGEYLHTIVGGRIEEQDQGNTLEEKAESSAKRESWEEVQLGISELVYIGMNLAVGKDIDTITQESTSKSETFIKQQIFHE